MAKWVCNVCGYVYEGDAAPEVCPQCKAPASKFTEQKGEMTWAAEHVVVFSLCSAVLSWDIHGEIIGHACFLSSTHCH